MTRTLHATPGLADATAFAPPVITGTSSEQALDILFQALLDVARRHDPELEAVLHGTADISRFSPQMLARALQVQGIWFQLISIAEQNAAMRRRRHVERTEGPSRARRLLRQGVFRCPRPGRAPGEDPGAAAASCASGRRSPPIRPRASG